MVKLEVDVRGRPLKCSIYMGDYSKNVLDDAKRLLDNNWDYVAGYFGDEGDGKTTASFIHAYYLNADFNISKVAFNGRQFEECVLNANEYDCVVWEEADDLTGHWASKVIQTLKRMFKRIRMKKLFIILNTPSMFDLGKYFVIHRLRAVWHIYADGFDRGFIRFFNKENKRGLYINGFKIWDMYAWRPNFVDRFGKIPEGFPIDMSPGGEYERKKEEALHDIEDVNPKFKKSSALIKLDRLLFQKRNDPVALKRPFYLTQEEYSFIFEMDRSNISKMLIKYNEREDVG